MKRTIKKFIVLIAILFILSPTCFSADVDFKNQIKSEDGSLFEKIIAECIGGIAQTVFNFTTGETAKVGFKDYDTLIFNRNNNNLSPFTEDLWNKTMNYYKIFATISSILILIAVFILSYKIISAGMNTSKKNDAKDSLMRLVFGGVFIMLAPLFIRFLLYINNSLVNLLVTASSGSLENLLGNSMLTSIKTGNAITTALVISMFIYLFVKLNIKFIIREFTIIIFTIFTPVACSLWIINRNVTAASIWAGQIIMNIFMQFIYCFLFIIYLAFLPAGGGWAVSLIWAMMILPLADTLQNCLQNLTSRIAGLDNEQMSGRVLGIGAMLGFGLSAIKEQFNTPNSSAKTDKDNSLNSGFSGFVNRAKSIINPATSLSPEKDYDGNINPIRDIIPKQTIHNNNSVQNSNINNSKDLLSNNKSSTNENEKSKTNVVTKIAKTTLSGARTYLNIGASMVEGNFNGNVYKKSNPQKYKSKFKSMEYIASTKEPQELGDNIEDKETYKK